MQQPTPAAMLAEIVSLAVEVEATKIAPNPDGARPRVMRPALGSRPPVSVGAVHALTADGDRPYVGIGLRGQLGMCVRLIIEEMSDDPALTTADIPNYPPDTWAGICGWLVATCDYWTATLWADDIRHDIGDVRNTLRNLARVPPPLRLECPRCRFPVHEQAGGAYYRCEAGHIIDHHAEVRRMGALQHAPLAEVADLLAIPSGTLRRWAADGLISPAPGAGRPRLYAIADVRNVAERVRRR